MFDVGELSMQATWESKSFACTLTDLTEESIQEAVIAVRRQARTNYGYTDDFMAKHCRFFVRLRSGLLMEILRARYD